MENWENEKRASEKEARVQSAVLGGHSRTPVQLNIETVIHTVAREGRGTEEDPVRLVDQYWSLKGKLLATVDPIDREKLMLNERGGEWDGDHELSFK